MSKTHITIGTSCALLASMSNQSPATACLALAGGALGGVMPDVDIICNDRTGDARQGQIVTATIVVITFVIDKIFNYGAYKVFDIDKNLLLGTTLFIILYIFGMKREHRGFTHSILSLIVYSIPITLIYEPVLEYFIIGYWSHLMIDLLNKRGIQLLFPLKFKFCFKACYANGLGNKMLMFLGLVTTVLLLIKHLVV